MLGILNFLQGNYRIFAIPCQELGKSSWQSKACQILQDFSRSWQENEKVVKFFKTLFSVEIFFERKIFNSVVGVFFFVLKLPMTRRVYKSAKSRWCLVQYVCRVSPRFRSWRRGVRIPLSTIFFYVFSDTR